MIAAMMLPTTYPVLGIFRVMTRSRADARRLLGLVAAGFFAAWFAFGLLAHALDATLAWLGGRAPWLIGHGWAAAVAVLAAAGLFQFSALKYRCLEQCRTPLAFVASRWHGRAPAREAFASASTTASSASAAAGPDAVHVRGRHRQPRLDAGPRGA